MDLGIAPQTEKHILNNIITCLFIDRYYGRQPLKCLWSANRCSKTAQRDITAEQAANMIKILSDDHYSRD